MSTVKTNAAQIGQSLTATNNFTMYQPSSPDGTVRWGVGNSGSVTDIITLNSSGNVGIGTSSPGNKLDVIGRGRFVQDSAATTGAVIIRQDDTNTIGGYIQWVNNANTVQTGYLGVLPDSTWVFGQSSAERMRIDSSGNVGIGTSSPGYKLDAIQNTNGDGSIQITNANTGTGAIASFRAASSTNTAWFGIGGSSYGGYAQIRANGAAIYTNSGAGIGLSADNSAGYITFGTGTAAPERMRIDSSGNVGIGSVNPTYRLVVVGTSADAIANFRNTQTANGNFGYIIVGPDNGSGAIIGQVGHATTTSQYAFVGNIGDDVVNGVGLLVYRGTGAVSINKKTPGSTLDVGGNVQATHILSAGYAYRVRAESGGTLGGIQFTNNAANTDWAYITSPQANVLNFSAPDGQKDSTLANFVFNAGSVCINKQTATGGDIGDWPQPSLGVRGYDSNFNYVTMQTWGLRDDNVMYQTSNAVWNFRLGTSSSGATTSGSNTELSINGPGFLTCLAGSGGVILNNGATSWASLSDETLKDIIEPITGAAEKVASLRAVIGKYKTDADGKRRPFLIAQDVQAVLPEAVGTMQVPTAEVDPEDPYKVIPREEKLSLSYTETIPLLVAAIKELKAELDATKAEVATLRKGA